MSVLWLDDIRDPAEHGYVGAKWAKTYDEAIALLNEEHFEFASLDHDLSVTATLGYCQPYEKTGYDVVCWMEEHNVWPRDGVRVHSLNPSGRQRMEAALRANGKLA